MKDLSVSIGRVRLPYPLMVAAGVCKKMEGESGKCVIDLVRASFGGLVLGSFTVKARLGNSGTPYRANAKQSINSMGLPGPDIEELRRILPAMIKAIHDAGMAAVVSVAGFNAEDFAILAEVAFECGADAVEYNYGCPNVLDDGTQHDVISFDPVLIALSLDLTALRFGALDRDIWVKVSPYSNPNELKRIAAIVRTFPFVKAVVACNAFPNGLAFDEQTGETWITPNNGMGGLAGPVMKSIALGQVKQWRAALPETIRVIGVGGVESGQDVLDFMRAGADAVQMATGVLQNTPAISGKILEEYLELTGQAV